jgi:hypothetical protein
MKNSCLKNLCFLTISLTILCSCSGAGSSNVDNVIDVESVVGSGKIRNASDFIKEIKYIPLETTSNSMVGNIESIIIDHRKMYVRDNKNVITIFDLNGKYLSTLNRMGRGPEEYLSISDFEIASNGNIFIASRSEGLIEYSSDLKFTRKISPEGGRDAGLSDLMLLKDNLFASNSIVIDMETRSAKQEWKVYDDSFNTLFSYSADPKMQSSSSGSGENRTVAIGIRINPYQYYMYNNDLNLFRAGNDTIFNIDYENNYLRSARYVVNCGKYQFSEEMEGAINMNSPSGPAELEAISLGSTLETDNYLFMAFNFRKLAPEPFETEGSRSSSGGREIRIGGGTNTTVNAVYDKKSGKLSLLNQPIPQKFGLKNDINSGAPFWPRSITKNKELISWHNALDLVLLAEEGKIDQSIVANLKEDDNPVVAIAIPK